jgi:hypothetical protein
VRWRQRRIDGLLLKFWSLDLRDKFLDVWYFHAWKESTPTNQASWGSVFSIRKNIIILFVLNLSWIFDFSTAFTILKVKSLILGEIIESSFASKASSASLVNDLKVNWRNTS